MKKIIIFGIICLFSLGLPLVVEAESTPGRTMAAFLNVRSGPSSTTTNITSIIYGTDITIIERSGDWYKIIYDTNAQGWVHGSYVEIFSEITLVDAAYCATMVAAGFDATYCPYLSHLHKLYPNWTFTPLITNLEWTSVVSGQAGKNYIQSTRDAYLDPLKKNANGTPILAEGGGWYFANQNVIAYFLDPRNFLTESKIFMFENLSYNSNYQTAAITKGIFPTTSYLYNDTYIDYFMQAAAAYNISPIHLAARVRQEGGSDESYGPVSGLFTTKFNQYFNGISLDGYYNYYNINAYEQSGYSPQTMGLAYACGPACGYGNSFSRPWTTREIAIKGGAQWIANGYINAGQYTLYLQKFNTNPLANNPVHTHQYMTNVMAPLSEASRSYSAYKSNSLTNTPFNFSIPVYKNMPVKVSQPSTLSNNSYLNNLMVNNNLVSSFDEDILSYNYYVTTGTSSVEVSASAAQAGATVTGTGTIVLTSDSTTVTVVVTAQNGTKRTYTINIIRVADTSTINEIINRMSVRISGLSLGGFKVGTNIVTLRDIIQKASPSTSIVIKDAGGNVQTNDILRTGYTVAFKTLLNEEQTKTIAVNGDVSGDGEVTILDLLKIQKHILGSSDLENAYKDAGDVNFDNVIGLVDLLKVQKYLLGSGSL